MIMKCNMPVDNDRQTSNQDNDNPFYDPSLAPLAPVFAPPARDVLIVGLDAGANYGIGHFVADKKTGAILNGPHAETITAKGVSETGGDNTLKTAMQAKYVLERVIGTAQQYFWSNLDVIFVCETGFIGRNANTFGLASLALRYTVWLGLINHFTTHYAVETKFNRTIAFFEPHALTLKKQVAGKGRATKKDMKDAVMRHLLLFKPIAGDHNVDALAMCVWALNNVVKGDSAHGTAICYLGVNAYGGGVCANGVRPSDYTKIAPAKIGN